MGWADSPYFQFTKVEKKTHILASLVKKVSPQPAAMARRNVPWAMALL
jgi:hypothetical protein